MTGRPRSSARVSIWLLTPRALKIVTAPGGILVDLIDQTAHLLARSRSTSVPAVYDLMPDIDRRPVFFERALDDLDIAAFDPRKSRGAGPRTTQPGSCLSSCLARCRGWGASRRRSIPATVRAVRAIDWRAIARHIGSLDAHGNRPGLIWRTARIWPASSPPLCYHRPAQPPARCQRARCASEAAITTRLFATFLGARPLGHAPCACRRCRRRTRCGDPAFLRRAACDDERGKASARSTSATNNTAPVNTASLTALP